MNDRTLDRPWVLIAEREITTKLRDKTFIGSPIPDLVYGLGARISWRRFDVATTFSGQSGNEIFNGKKAAPAAKSGSAAHRSKSARRAMPGASASPLSPRTARRRASISGRRSPTMSPCRCVSPGWRNGISRPR